MSKDFKVGEVVWIPSQYTHGKITKFKRHTICTVDLEEEFVGEWNWDWLEKDAIGNLLYG